MSVTARVARDGQASKQRRDLVVKREKSKAHEAQTTKVLEIQQLKRAGGPVLGCTAANDDQNLHGGTVESRQRQRSLRTSWQRLRLTGATGECYFQCLCCARNPSPDTPNLALHRVYRVKHLVY